MTKTFIKFIMKQEHKLLTQAEVLWDQVKDRNKLTQEQLDIYESLDQQFTISVATAENQCSKIHPNDMEFSPEVKEAIGNLTIWKEI